MLKEVCDIATKRYIGFLVGLGTVFMLMYTSNYRPITVQSHIFKVFEKLVLIKNNHQLTIHIIMEEQLSFYPGRSTTTCNLMFCNFVFKTFSLSSQVDVLYTNFKKAFYLVNHKVLIEVLKNLDLVNCS